MFKRLFIKRINNYVRHITTTILADQYVRQLNEAKNNNIFDMFKHLSALLNDEMTDKIKDQKVRNEIEKNACQVTTKPYIVYKKITYGAREREFVATLLLPIGSTIVRSFREEWSNKTDMYYYMNKPLLDVHCYLSNNMRVNQAIMVEVEAMDGKELPTKFRSYQVKHFKYPLNELIICDLDIDVRVEERAGIHVVASKKEAKDYYFL